MKKYIVITGGTSGIGQQTAMVLAQQGHHVIVTGRDATRGQAGVAEIMEQSGNSDVSLVLGDLSHRAGVRELAAELRTRFPRIDVLINNAGAYHATRTLNVDGLEAGFAMNVVAPYGLIQELLPSLEAAKTARVVNVTGGEAGGVLDPSNLQAEKSGLGLQAYSHSKRALDALSFVLAPELAKRGIFLNLVYPGQALTRMTRSVEPRSLPWYLRPFWTLLFTLRGDDGGKSARKASRSSVYAATAPELEGVSGRYFDTNCRPGNVHVSVSAPENQQRVLELVRAAWQAPSRS